jgi:hypothetical protein
MGNNPGWVTGQIPSAAAWNAEWASKQDDLGGHFVASLLGLNGAVSQAQLTAAITAGLPTTNPHVVGAWWLNGEAICISQG